MSLVGMWLTGTEGALPAAGVTARLYFATDTSRIFLDTGSAWVRLNLIPRGVYAGGTTYYEKDLVTYNGSVWRALATVTGVTPVEGANWTLFVSKGDAGSGVASVDGVSNTGGDIDLVAGSNITITPNDAANTITFAATGGSPPFLDSFALVMDNIDNTKKMNIECTDIGTGQWRNLRMPNADVDLTDDVSFPSVNTFNARDLKNSVRAATTANITLSGTQTVDGVALVAGNRCGVKNQTTGSQNGIYDVAAGAWTRSSDANTSAKVTPQLFFRVEEGTANGGKAFVLTNTGAITLGTTALTFAENTPTPAAHGPSHNPNGGDVIQRFQTIPWVFDGTLAVTTGNKQVPIFIPTGSNTPTLISAAARITTAPTGSAVTFDLNKNGTTVWTGGTNRLTVAASANSGSTTTFDVSTFASLDYFTVDIDTVGSTTAGTHAVFALTYRY